MKTLFILYESIFLISFSSVIEPAVQLNENRAADSTSVNPENTKTAAKNQIWDITLSTGQMVINMQPVEVRDQSLLLMRGDTTYTFQIWNIVRLKVPNSRVSRIKQGMERGFLIPLKKGKDLPDLFGSDPEFETMSGFFLYLVFMSFIMLFAMIFLFFIGIFGAIIGGTVGTFRQSEKEIDLYQMRVSEKVKLIQKLLGD